MDPQTSVIVGSAVAMAVEFAKRCPGIPLQPGQRDAILGTTLAISLLAAAVPEIGSKLDNQVIIETLANALVITGSAILTWMVTLRKKEGGEHGKESIPPGEGQGDASNGSRGQGEGQSVRETPGR